MSAPRIRGHRRAGPLRARLEARHFGIVEIPTAIALGAAAASAAAGATSAIVQSRQASATADYNKDISEQQAELARRAGSAAEADTREQSARIMALQRAQLGDSGITGEGTPLLLLLDSAQQAEVEAGRARYSGQVNEQAAEASANLYRSRGAQARSAGVIGAGTSLLTGAAQAGSAYYGRRRQTDPNL